MKENNKAVERKAKQLARDYVNRCRAKAGKPAAKRIEPLWWKIHGQAWMDIAQEHFSGLGADARIIPPGWSE